MKHRAVSSDNRNFIRQHGEPGTHANAGPQDDRLIVPPTDPIWDTLDTGNGSSEFQSHDYTAVHRMAGSPVRVVVTQPDLQP